VPHPLGSRRGIIVTWSDASDSSMPWLATSSPATSGFFVLSIDEEGTFEFQLVFVKP
jgi:hypothetical protein